MRHGTSNRRQRNRGSGGNGGSGGNRPSQNRMQVFDSNGPDVRIRGTAHQVTEKYMILAKDANSAGDRILAESYLQHAEHYQRIISTWDEGVQERRPQPEFAQPNGNSQPSQDDDLSLPTSILGAVAQSRSQEAMAERTHEVAAE
jgi:hypothetical protein